MFNKSCKHSFEKTISYADETQSRVLSITYFCDGCGMMKTERFSPPCNHELETHIIKEAADAWDDTVTTIVKICNLCGENFTKVITGELELTIPAEPRSEPEESYQPEPPEPPPDRIITDHKKPEPPPTRLVTEGAKPAFRKA